MKKLIVTLFFISSFSLADDCKYFQKSQFIGIYNVTGFKCEDSGSETTCENTKDQYKSVSEIHISLVPLTVEQGLMVELIDNSRPTGPEVAEKYVFAEVTTQPNEKTSCSHSSEKGLDIYVIKEESSVGPLKSYIMVTKKGDGLEFETWTSFEKVSTKHTFTLSK